MAPKPDRLVFVFGMVLAMAVTILAITTWAAPPKPESDSAAPISARQTIYQARTLEFVLRGRHASAGGMNAGSPTRCHDPRAV
jgi:hypothetical protein